MITETYSLTTTELNVLKVMAEKDIDWTWMILDRTLATRGIPRFSNVVNIVTNLMNEGMVDAVYNENSSRLRYRVSEQGHQLLGQIDEVTRDYDIS
ncbi:MarR family transcriptional regulator [Klebsiella sp. 141130]|uniref:MarR family transcriptional regulator n=1 Tax=Klebsiella TaxID=570 RepID=UPI0037C1DA42